MYVSSLAPDSSLLIFVKLRSYFWGFNSGEMSQVYEGYERQYCELSANLSRKCNSASSLLDGGIVELVESVFLENGVTDNL